MLLLLFSALLFSFFPGLLNFLRSQTPETKKRGVNRANQYTVGATDFLLPENLRILRKSTTENLSIPRIVCLVSGR